METMELSLVAYSSVKWPLLLIGNLWVFLSSLWNLKFHFFFLFSALFIKLEFCNFGIVKWWLKFGEKAGETKTLGRHISYIILWFRILWFAFSFLENNHRLELQLFKNSCYSLRQHVLNINDFRDKENIVWGLDAKNGLLWWGQLYFKSNRIFYNMFF